MSRVTDIDAQSHDGRELELMLADRKPLAAFSTLVLQEEQPDFEELYPEFRGLSLRPAGLAMSSKFALGLDIDTLPHLISQINHSLRRSIEILPHQ